jgi:tRNA-dihydrouridine synthase B
MMAPLEIGPLKLPNALVLAPMAGVTDRVFRLLCRQLGAGLAVSEMLTSDVGLWKTRKSQLRMNHQGEPEPVGVQIAGADPEMLARAARESVDRGADLIDINMGCPAKKVCKVMAGSALLADEALVGRILDAVVASVSVPVTLKIRTGPSLENRNGVTIARMAESAGIRALAVHGRTRTEKYQGQAEYQTIAQIKDAVNIPVIANGDIDSPQKAAEVLTLTGADALMIGRAAQGNPWIFNQINHFLEYGEVLPDPDAKTVRSVMTGHLAALHDFYGEYLGVRVARKHIGWYLSGRPHGELMRRRLMRQDTGAGQIDLLNRYFKDPETALAA